MGSTTSFGIRNACLDGYVHKFRFEGEHMFTADEARVVAEEVVTATVERSSAAAGERRLLAGFLVSVIVLSGALLAVVSVLHP
jgi:hypothetical protein